MTSGKPALPRPRVLAVDDDPKTLRQLIRALGATYDVRPARPGPTVLAQLEREWPDLVVLEPADAGADRLARAIRQRVDIPIIALSRASSSQAKIRALRAYAEDYLTKPFDTGELEARIDRVLRRLHGRLPAKDLRLSPEVTLVLPRRMAIVRGCSVELTPAESRLLAVLTAELGQVVPTDAIAAQVGGPRGPAFAGRPTVWACVAHVRNKIERDPAKPKLLLTAKGLGYRLTTVE